MIGDLTVGEIKTDKPIECHYCHKTDIRVKRFILYREGIMRPVEGVLDSHLDCILLEDEKK